MNKNFDLLINELSSNISNIGKMSENKGKLTKSLSELCEYIIKDMGINTNYKMIEPEEFHKTVTQPRSFYV